MQVGGQKFSEGSLLEGGFFQVGVGDEQIFMSSEGTPPTLP